MLLISIPHNSNSLQQICVSVYDREIQNSENAHFYQWEHLAHQQTSCKQHTDFMVHFEEGISKNLSRSFCQSTSSTLKFPVDSAYSTRPPLNQSVWGTMVALDQLQQFNWISQIAKFLKTAVEILMFLATACVVRLQR